MQTANLRKGLFLYCPSYDMQHEKGPMCNVYTQINMCFLPDQDLDCLQTKSEDIVEYIDEKKKKKKNNKQTNQNKKQQKHTHTKTTTKHTHTHKTTTTTTTTTTKHLNHTVHVCNLIWAFIVCQNCKWFFSQGLYAPYEQVRLKLINA